MGKKAGKRPQTVWGSGRRMHDNVVVVDDDDHDDQTNILIALRNSMNISYGFVLEYFFNMG
jgi:hypothetical protein